MAQWIRVATLDSCPTGSVREIVVGEQVFGLFNIDGRIHALDGICPHQGGPLAKGRIDGHVVTCPWHGWQFDVRTGRHEAGTTICQPTLDVKVEEGIVFVRGDDKCRDGEL